MHTTRASQKNTRAIMVVCTDSAEYWLTRMPNLVVYRPAWLPAHHPGHVHLTYDAQVRINQPVAKRRRVACEHAALQRRRSRMLAAWASDPMALQRGYGGPVHPGWATVARS